jgi:hypothetical protein
MNCWKASNSLKVLSIFLGGQAFREAVAGMNKRIFTIFLIPLFLASCAKAEIPPTPTSPPNPTSSPIHSPTFTTTPTEDPLAGAPEGTTGKNSNGEWTRTVEIEGKKLEQVYTVIKNKNSEVMYAEWVRVKTPGDGVPIWESSDPKYNGPAIGYVQLVCSDTYDGCTNVPKFAHIPLTSEDGTLLTLEKTTGAMLYSRTHNGQSPIGQDIGGFTNSFTNGLDINFYIGDPENIYTWHLAPKQNTSVVEILTTWDDPIFEGGTDIQIDSYFTFRSKILGVDEQGRLVGVVALNKFPPAGAEYIWSHVIFLLSSMVLQHEDVKALTKARDISVLGDIVFESEHESSKGNPWIIVEPDN